MNKSGTASQVIAHPTGGGAIKGLGDTFSPDLHTGTGNLSVPIALLQGRNGLQPELTLVYSTGQGNGPFGLGWSLSVPGVSRDTAKQIPVYDDDADVFLLSGAEQLVPMPSGSPGVIRYRPRTEGLFARITHLKSGAIDYWEVRSRNGLISLYGDPSPSSAGASTVCDPDDVRRIFSWHLTQTRDPFGNRIEYIYEREHKRTDGPHNWDQLYLKTIRYGDYGPSDNPQFMVTVDFFYETRPDPFSSYKSGFELRTTQRCTRIEISTHADVARLARVYHLIYLDQAQPQAPPLNGASLLQSIQVAGVDGDAYEQLPPLEFGYTSFSPDQRRYQALSGVSGALPERSLAHPDFELADLFGCGLPDVVQIGDTARYWRNLGNGRFDVPRPIQQLPPGIRLGDPGVQLADADGDGHIDLVISGGRVNGYLPLTVSGNGANGHFVQYAAAPAFPLNDPEVRLLDLDGDGTTDALRTGAQFELFFHDRELGWNRAETRSRGEFDRFPDVHFSDPRVKLADMTGDGLQDIVFVSGGSVAYWPYLGNGRWGRRVAMDGQIRIPDAPAFGGIGFNPKRLLIGDVDGDGLSDLVYVESGRITIWLNQSGNRWSDPIVVRGTPPISDIDSVRLVDVLGNGTDGVLWSYDFATFSDSTYKFLDLTGGLKPYLLNQRDNNTGTRILVEYTPSTRFYLADEAQPQTRWQTRLPFPVQVVSRVEVIDQLSGGKLTTEYRYHQGYWDGDEREFRGFGMVEQFDTETFDRYHGHGLHGSQKFDAVDPVHFSPPTLTRTWFHQGMVQNSAGVWSEADASAGYWAGDPPMLGREQRQKLTAIAQSAAKNAEPSQLRHALRALRGSILRSELYGLDDAPYRDRPYTVTETLYDTREVEPIAQGVQDRLRVFLPFQIASRTIQWERGAEPMTQFAFAGEPDPYGLPKQQLAIAVPRGRNPLMTLSAAAEPYLSTYAVTEYAQRDDAKAYIVDRVARTTSHEVVNDGTPSVFALHDTVQEGSGSLRVIGHARSFYDGDAFVGLPLGQLGGFGALVRSESLVFTDQFLDTLFDPADPLKVSPRPVFLDPEGVTAWPAEYPDEFKTLLPPLGGYLHYRDEDMPGSPGGYYVVAERHHYDFQLLPDPAHPSPDPTQPARGLLVASRDALGAEGSIAYDAYQLLPVQATDAVGVTTTAQYDYRVLQASSITDANGNIASFAFSPAGFLADQFVRGKNGEGDGDHPSVHMDYDLLAFRERHQPIFVRTTRRMHHDSETDVAMPQHDDTITSVEYSDGFGRLLQTRAQAEDILFGDRLFGGNVIDADQSVAVGDTVGHARQPADPDNVVVSGWQVYDNKGRVVQKYEPFFAQGYDFAAPASNQLGQKATIFYDPRGHMVRTVNPDGSEQRVVFGVSSDLTKPDDYAPTPWESYTYDENDNAVRTHGAPASAYASHWNTPASAVVDALGRTVTAIARNGPDPGKDWYVTRSSYDIQGNLISITDALGRIAFRYASDLAKRRWRMDSIDAGRRDTVCDALGNPIESRDSKGALSLHAYDKIHRPLRLWARDDNAGTVTLRQRFEYGDGSSAAQPTAERSAARNLNLLGQLVRHHDEAGLSTVAGVDFKGNALDKFRRVIADAPLLAVFEAAPANGWQVTPFQVDWQPPPLGTLGDREGALLESTAYQTTASYDALNRVKIMTFPQDVEGNRRQLHLEYNRAGGLDQVSLDDTLYVERIAYDAKGQRALIAYGNGVMTGYAYDPQTFRLQRLRSEHYSKPAAVTYRPNGEVLQDYGYDYDLVGNILGIRDRTPGSGILNNPNTATATAAGNTALAKLLASADALNRSFNYDPIYRLLTASGRECDRAPDGPPWQDQPRCTDLTKTRAYSEQYAYDPMGNMLSLDHGNGADGYTREFTVEAGSNRFRSMKIGEDTYAYGIDANGNMRSETISRHFEWNHADQMKAFRTQTDGAEPSVYAQYLYDGTGQRVKKLVRKQSGQVEVAHYIGGVFEHRRWSTTQAGENNHLHVMDDKQRIALVRLGNPHPDDRAPPLQFQLGDHLGSSNVVVDSAGSQINREEFTPYGETTFGSFAKKRYRFTGNERDEESGLNYHGARYYAAWKARWVTVDPEQPRFPAWSPFCYCFAHPLGYVDTMGTEPQADTITVYSRTGARSAKVMSKGISVLLNKSHVWLGEGFYSSNSPNIPGSTAGGNTVISVKIRADNVVDVTDELGPLYQESGMGKGLRSATSGWSYNQDEYPFWREILHKSKMDEILWRKYSDKTFAIRMADGTTHYIVRSTKSFVGKPTTVGTIDKSGNFVATARSKMENASEGTDESGSIPKAGGRGIYSIVKGAITGAAVTTIFSLVTKGELPDVKELAVGAATGAAPILGVTTAKNHDETVVPLMLYATGPQIARAAPYVAYVAFAAAALVYGAPQASARGMSGHFLGAKGGLENLVCFYPGLHKCK